MIRDVTGLNEARDGSQPDPNALVGLQKMAANASNIATKHILDASLYLSLRVCENISLRIADALEFGLTNQALKNSLNQFNVSTLEEIKNLSLHDFGIYLELEPDDEERAMVEQNIQVALQSGQIYLEDAIDIREIKNLQLANQVLKFRRIKKQEADQAAQQAQIQAQAQANIQQSEAAAMNEVEKQQALAQTEIQIEQAKSQFEIQRMEQEALIKKQLMAEEFQYQLQLAQAQVTKDREKEQFIEDRKDKRTKIQATQQSQMIEQRQNDLLPTDFESSGNDNLGGFGLEQFTPQ
jgi:DNA polymerase III gamma/tau subunit